MTYREFADLISWRADQGWYYDWDLDYNSDIDWSGHPGGMLVLQ